MKLGAYAAGYASKFADDSLRGLHRRLMRGFLRIGLKIKQKSRSGSLRSEVTNTREIEMGSGSLGKPKVICLEYHACECKHRQILPNNLYRKRRNIPTSELEGSTPLE